MLFIYQSSIVTQILDFIHWTVTIFSFDHMTGKKNPIQKKRRRTKFHLSNEVQGFYLIQWDMLLLLYVHY